MPVQKFSVSLMPEIVEQIERRGDERSTTINRSLERYFEVLDTSRQKLVELLTDQEVGLILDVLNGTLFSEPFSIQLVDREIADSLIDGYAEKWEVDGKVLVEKLRSLRYVDLVALVDAVERWWERVGRGEDRLKPGEALKPAAR